MNFGISSDVLIAAQIIQDGPWIIAWLGSIWAVLWICSRGGRA